MRFVRIEQRPPMVQEFLGADYHRAGEVSVLREFHGGGLAVGFQPAAAQQSVRAGLSEQDQMRPIADADAKAGAAGRFDGLDRRFGFGLLAQALDLHGGQEFCFDYVAEAFHVAYCSRNRHESQSPSFSWNRLLISFQRSRQTNCDGRRIVSSISWVSARKS